MTGKCMSCKFWRRYCQDISDEKTMWLFGIGWDKVPDDGKELWGQCDYVHHDFKADLLAFVCESELSTREDFGCNQWSPHNDLVHLAHE